jgi:hypothetical protein
MTPEDTPPFSTRQAVQWLVLFHDNETVRVSHSLATWTSIPDEDPYVSREYRDRAIFSHREHLAFHKLAAKTLRDILNNLP